MPDIPIYDNDRVRLTWGGTSHICHVHTAPPSHRCYRCNGPTVRLDPPWQGWRLLCCQESALTSTQAELDAGQRHNPMDSIGLVSQVPIRLERLPPEGGLTHAHHPDL